MKTAIISLVLMLMPVAAFAQSDLTGDWQGLNQNDNMERGGGPDLADYAGLPINDEARAVGLAYNPSIVSMEEHSCTFYTENYITFAPHNIQIERVDDPVTGGISAWKVSAGGSDRAPIPIWMDGRPKPGPFDLHTYSGFTTGEWQGPVLTGEMTHMKRGISRRNGAPLSDQATMTIHLKRQGNLLTIMTVTQDPIYLTEPLVQAGVYRLNIGGNTPAERNVISSGSGYGVVVSHSSDQRVIGKTFLAQARQHSIAIDARITSFMDELNREAAQSRSQLQAEAVELEAGWIRGAAPSKLAQPPGSDAQSPKSSLPHAGVEHSSGSRTSPQRW